MVLSDDRGGVLRFHGFSFIPDAVSIVSRFWIIKIEKIYWGYH